MSQPLQVDTDSGKGECPSCGKWFKINADGTLRAHTCVGLNDFTTNGPDDLTIVAPDTPTTSKRGASKRPRASSKTAPDNVKRLGRAGLASGTELLAKQYILRSTGVDPARVDWERVTDISKSDAEVMYNPFIDLLWPQIPARGQKAIRAIADREDIIEALFAWGEYGKRVNDVAKQITQQLAQEQPQRPAPITPVATAPPSPDSSSSNDREHTLDVPTLGGNGNGFQKASGHAIDLSGLRPFEPVPASPTTQ